MSSRLPTELALASDGTLYMTAEGRDPVRLAHRRQFVGYALRKGELARIHPARVFGWVVLGRCAIGCDGRIYVADESLEKRGRMVFRGFAMTTHERDQIVESLYRLAPGIVIESCRE